MGPLLVELRVRDLGVIDDVTVAFQPGMTALTGETGAGKTLLVEALSLLLGGRADPSMVRAGADQALVEGRFVAPDRIDRADDRDDERGEITLARSVARQGRSKAWIDGRMATVGSLAEVAGRLIEIHGQHQHRSLIHTEAQRLALDAFGGIDRSAAEAARRRVSEIEGQLTSLGGDARQRAREADLFRYQIDEIERAGVEDPGEDSRLEVVEDRLATASTHRLAAATALAAVSGEEGSGAVDALARAAGALDGHEALAGLSSRVRSAMADLADLAAELRTVVETWEDDPARLEEVRSRRQLLHQLERKYGPGLDGVLAFATEARRQLAAIDDREHRSAALDIELESTRAELTERQAEVAAARRKVAPQLAGEIENTLHQLALPSARFTVTVEGEGAADQVSFGFSANPGEPPQALAKVASGGELARTMLAIRLAISEAAGVMIFDEVDAGVGGAAATSVGTALAGLGREAQVLVVTHLAQVAAQADHQVGVRKVERSGRTRSEVTVLEGEDRVVELSRMLSGRPDSDSARRHAVELLGAGTGVPDGDR